MATRRLLFVSVLLLAAGLGLLFGYCEGTAGFSAGWPISATALKIALTTTGFPALTGFVLTLLGLFFLAITLISALLAEIRHALTRSRSSKPVEDPLSAPPPPPVS